MCDNQNVPSHEGFNRAEWVAFVEKMNITDVNVIDMLNNTRPEAKEEFLTAHELSRPNNVYAQLDIKRVEKNINTIIALKKELGSLRIPKKQKEIALLILGDNLKKNRFVHVNYLYNHSSPNNREVLAQEHYRANIDLYGKPDENVFWSILGEKLSAIPVGDLSKEDKIMYGELIEMIGPVQKAESKIFRPQKETVDWFSFVIQTFFTGFLSHIPKGQKKFSIAEACAITNEIISSEFGLGSETGLGADSWMAMVISSGAVASTDCEQKLIRFPGQRSRGDYTREELKAIIIHELGVHMLRSLPYEACKIQSLAFGFPGYEAFEEGVAKAAEQAINHRYEDSGLLHYISIGLAYFLRKNFREVFEIQHRIEHLTKGEPDGRCFDSVQRAFRGTDELPNHKDLIYYNGVNEVWKYIEDHLNDADLMDQLFLSGKTCMNDKIHERIIYAVRTGEYF
ncbi:DUF1704 domain-containing protein [bacterium 1XD21-13]|nr:DUF1704 domain-containing protein [bacterium 1XD21-13]